MSEANARLLDLHGALDSIRGALARGEFDAMPTMLDHYDHQVGAFCATPGARELAQDVRALLAAQEEAVALMKARQEQLQVLIRQQQRSMRAVQAYSSGEVA